MKRQTPRRRTVPTQQGHPQAEAVGITIINNRSKEVLHQEQHEQQSISESLINPAHVSVSLAATKNLGDFESARVSVMITRPCKDTPEDIERVYKECSEWADGKIVEEVGKV